MVYFLSLACKLTIATSSFMFYVGNGSEPVTTTLHQPCQNATAVVDDIDSQIITGYIKPVYPVLVGDSVRICSTSLFASLPQHNKFLVKERLHDHTVGFSRAKLVLKSCVTEVEEKNTKYVSNVIKSYVISSEVPNYFDLLCTISEPRIVNLYQRKFVRSNLISSSGSPAVDTYHSMLGCAF